MVKSNGSEKEISKYLLFLEYTQLTIVTCSHHFVCKTRQPTRAYFLFFPKVNIPSKIWYFSCQITISWKKVWSMPFYRWIRTSFIYLRYLRWYSPLKNIRQMLLIGNLRHDWYSYETYVRNKTLPYIYIFF